MQEARSRWPILRANSLSRAARVLLPLVGDCTPPTPETQLSWGVDDTPHTAWHSTRTASTVPHRPMSIAATMRDPADVTPTLRPSPSQAVETMRYSEPVSAGSPSFAWPVSGTIISTFGCDQSGARNDGINIAAKLGEPIHAAASGDVIYAGNELKGYGNLVLIKHSDGYVTAYAHAERMLVARGDTIAKGQVIAYAGSTGDVTSPQLHFEIRRDATPVNPRPLLVASR